MTANMARLSSEIDKMRDLIEKCGEKEATAAGSQSGRAANLDSNDVFSYVRSLDKGHKQYLNAQIKKEKLMAK